MTIFIFFGWTATHCNTLHHTATCYNTVQHTATRCNMLHHASIQCSTQQHTTYSTLHFENWRPSSSSSTDVQHTATHCSTQQHTSSHCSTLQHPAAPCSTLQHTAAHCNTFCNTFTTYKLLHSWCSGIFHLKKKRKRKNWILSSLKSWADSFVLIIYICSLTYGTWLGTCSTWPIHICYMTHSHVWHDSFACALQHTPKFSARESHELTPTRWLYVWGGYG